MQSTQGTMSFPQDFHEALRKFKDTANLTPDEEAGFRFTTLEKLQEAMFAIQSRHASSRKLQYMQRLQVFVETMDQYGKVIEVFTNAADLVAFIWVRIV